MLDDRWEGLEEIYKIEIENIKNYNHDELIKKAKIEDIDINDKTDEQIRQELIEIYEEEM